MAMLQGQFGLQRMQQKADPQLLLTNKLLQMSTMELQQRLATEIVDNPALEEDEFPCDRCEVAGPGCLGCPYNNRDFRARTLGPDNPRAAGEAVDAVSLAEAPMTLTDHLHIELRAVADPDELPPGDYLIENLDADGYLRCELEECAAALDCPLELAERALARLQSLDPTGVGARNLAECLCIQAAQLSESGEPARLAYVILRRCWKQFATDRVDLIARRLRCTTEEAAAAVDFIRHYLSPYPGRQFRPDWDKRNHYSSQSIRPDIVIHLDEEDQIQVQITDRHHLAVHLSPAFVSVWQQMRANPDSFSPGERRQVQDGIARATMFLKGLKDRRAILQQVTECIVEEQELFIRSERHADLRPLTQSRLASFLRVHESTVSRGVADKYAQLPSGQVVPLSFFFDRSLSLRRQIAVLIDGEDPGHPHSDQEISDILAARGIQLARRTVMKYREEMNILSSRQRARRRLHEGRRLAA